MRAVFTLEAVVEISHYRDAAAPLPSSLRHEIKVEQRNLQEE